MKAIKHSVLAHLFLCIINVLELIFLDLHWILVSIMTTLRGLVCNLSTPKLGVVLLTLHSTVLTPWLSMVGREDEAASRYS